MALARALASAGTPKKSTIGLCTFSCHQHWKAAGSKHPGVKFSDAPGFYRYARELGADGVQTPLRGCTATAMRELVEGTSGFYEGELRLPKTESDLTAFEAEVRQLRDAGATVARAVFTGGRRYEQFKTMEAFRAFHAQSVRALQWVEPVLRRHQLRMAIENHKDHTADELAAMVRDAGSEWIGVLVDTGNNIALLEEPHTAIETLAPFAFSVHLKDMAVQPCEDGFLLSEVPLGTGILDLPRVVTTLRKARPGIVFNLEMATRDPLRVPCLTDDYFATMPDRKPAIRDAALKRVRDNPPRGPVPSIEGQSVDRILADEESNNRQCLTWMQEHLRA